MSERKNSSAPTNTPTRRQWITGMAVAFGGVNLRPSEAWARVEEEISHSAEAIHQERVFKASRKRIYEALTDAKQFEKVVQLSAAMKSGMAPGAKSAEISREAGGAFSLFGGYVTGRQLELVPNERIVQAWRAGGWDPGDYSIARFQLVEQGTGTKIVLTMLDFPRAMRNTLRRAGRLIIGNRWRNSWVRRGHRLRIEPKFQGSRCFGTSGCVLPALERFFDRIHKQRMATDDFGDFDLAVGGDHDLDLYDSGNAESPGCFWIAGRGI